MKMSMKKKLELIQNLVDNYIPIGLDGELFRGEVQMVLNGKEPEAEPERPHKCIYQNGVCECGFKIEDHEENYGTPEKDAYGIKVGSKLWKNINGVHGEDLLFPANIFDF